MLQCSSPATHWIKVTETDRGHIVGAACWDLVETGNADGDAKMF
jgi:hypothetical protein